MLFALIGFYRDDAEQHLIEIARDVNEFLGQLLVPRRLAGVLRNRKGKKIGNVVVIDAVNFAEAEGRLKSPAMEAGLYKHCAIAELDLEIGRIEAD
jgi:hypothetical protein